MSVQIVKDDVGIKFKTLLGEFKDSLLIVSPFISNQTASELVFFLQQNPARG